MKFIVVVITVFLMLPLAATYGAYHHGGDTDSDIALQAYPAIAGTKLDSCALCHTRGQYEKKPGVFVTLGCCQWCHYTYGYDASGDITTTLNSYGLDYQSNGRNLAAFNLIEDLDSDMDSYPNGEEINALRFPGNPDDYGAKKSVILPC